ncbi:MAG: Uma2 family endonuclease [Paracoccaceae bacterium]
MSTLAPIHPKVLDREAYLALEQDMGERHEFVEGHAYAMVGASEAHNLIAMNLAAALHAARGPCRVFQQGMKLRIETAADEMFFYPDVMLCCDPADTLPLWKERPRFLAEVLSPSTAHNDFGLKLMSYRTIPSLEAYAVINTVAAEVTLYRREAAWRAEELDMWQGADLPAFGIRLDFDTLYTGVQF